MRLDNGEKQEIIERHKEGYHRHPEYMDEIKAMEQLSADAWMHGYHHEYRKFML